VNPLPVIPRPPRQKWRDFRARVLPVIVFMFTLGAISNLWHRHLVPQEVGTGDLAHHTSEGQKQVVPAKNLKERILQFFAVLPGDLSSPVVVEGEK
jgi:hypothetical protein